jgi:hypothetical protein
MWVQHCKKTSLSQPAVPPWLTDTRMPTLACLLAFFAAAAQHNCQHKPLRHHDNWWPAPHTPDRLSLSARVCLVAVLQLPNVVCVGATDDNDALLSASNYGLKTVHTGAPGLYILSTITGGACILDWLGAVVDDGGGGEPTLPYAGRTVIHHHRHGVTRVTPSSAGRCNGQ